MVDVVTGLLVPMGDVERMAEAMSWMIEHPAEAMEMGRKGRQRVLDQNTARSVEAVYREVLGLSQPIATDFAIHPQIQTGA